MVVTLLVAHVPRPQPRAELLKTPPKAGSAARLSSHFTLAARAWKLHILSCMPGCSIPRLRSGIAMQISPLLPETVIIKSEVVKQAPSIFGASPQQHMVIAES